MCQVNLVEAFNSVPTGFWRMQKYDSRFIFIGCSDNTVRLFDTKDMVGGISVVDRTDSDCEVLAVESSPCEAKYLLVGYGNGMVIVWDLDTSKKVLETSGCKNSEAGVFAVAWREDSCGIQ
jgi:WD40 repeat protein